MSKANPTTGERLATLETMMTNHLEHHRMHEQRLLWFIGILIPLIVVGLEFGLRKWLG